MFASASAANGQASSNFALYLSEGYRQIARGASRLEGQERLASYYNALSATARDGKLVMPQQPNARSLDAWTLREAGFARSQLLDRLQTGAGIRQPLLTRSPK